MKHNVRSFSGAALMLVIIPIFAGLLACMPVPIGDPERSRIDPDLNGVWAMDGEEDLEGIYLFQPWDKRTWLQVGVGIEAGSKFEGEPPTIESVDELATVLKEHPIGEDGITSRKTVLYKTWLAKIGGKKFMTWELVGGFNDDGGHVPEFWFVFRLEKVNANQFELIMLNPEFDGFDDIETPKEYSGDNYARDMRRTWEKAIKRNIDDEEMYADPMVMRRLPADAMEGAAELFEEVIEFEDL